MRGQESVRFSSNINPLTNTVPVGYTELGISKGVLYNYYVATNATVKAFFAPGTYPYKTSTIDGISMIWVDKEGRLWSTHYGSQDQTGSSLEIVST